MNEHAESKTPISSKFIGIITYIYIEKIILDIALLWGATRRIQEASLHNRKILIHPCS